MAPLEVAPWPGSSMMVISEGGRLVGGWVGKPAARLGAGRLAGGDVVSGVGETWCEATR